MKAAAPKHLRLESSCQNWLKGFESVPSLPTLSHHYFSYSPVSQLSAIFRNFQFHSIVCTYWFKVLQSVITEEKFIIRLALYAVLTSGSFVMIYRGPVISLLTSEIVISLTFLRNKVAESR